MKSLMITLVIVLFGTLSVLAQDVMVTVAPVQQVLPPQALMYVANPGRYFNVTITNVSSQTQYVYLGMDIERVFPTRVNVLSTPYNHQPSTPITISANQTIHLSMVDLKRCFSHLSSTEIRSSADIFSGFGNGSYGLFPEGQYKVQMTAYKWSMPKLSNPVIVSNISTGSGSFIVSYKAKAPEFLMPFTTNLNEQNVTEVDPLNAQFTWKESIITSFPKQVQYGYNFKVVEILSGQPVDYAMDHNPTVFQMRNILSPICIIPTNYITNRFEVGKVYAAQVTATPKTHNVLDYVMVDNSGKSDILKFRIVPVLQKRVEPKDTLQEDSLLAMTSDTLNISEDTDYSIDEYEKIINECVLSALDASNRAERADSIATAKYSELQKIINSMSVLSYPAAKKAGHTKNLKETKNDIETIAMDIKSLTEQATNEYINAYHAYRIINKLKVELKKSFKGADFDSVYIECVDGVSTAKNAALNCKSCYKSAMSTAAMAKEKVNKLYKLE